MDLRTVDPSAVDLGVVQGDSWSHVGLLPVSLLRGAWSRVLDILIFVSLRNLKSMGSISTLPLFAFHRSLSTGHHGRRMNI